MLTHFITIIFGIGMLKISLDSDPVSQYNEASRAEINMRTVILQYDTTGFHFKDCDGQEVVGIYDGDQVLFSSFLHGDDKVVTGSCHKDDAEIQALFLLGIPDA